MDETNHTPEIIKIKSLLKLGYKRSTIARRLKMNYSTLQTIVKRERIDVPKYPIIVSFNIDADMFEKILKNDQDLHMSEFLRVHLNKTL